MTQDVQRWRLYTFNWFCRLVGWLLREGVVFFFSLFCDLPLGTYCIRLLYSSALAILALLIYSLLFAYKKKVLSLSIYYHFFFSFLLKSKMSVVLKKRYARRIHIQKPIRAITQPLPTGESNQSTNSVITCSCHPRNIFFKSSLVLIFCWYLFIKDTLLIFQSIYF